MVVVKALSRGAWLHLARKHHNPDREDLCFGKSGEFSPDSDRAFLKHLNRLEMVTKFYSHLNGKRIKAIIREESPWYPLIQK